MAVRIQLKDFDVGAELARLCKANTMSGAFARSLALSATWLATKSSVP